APDRHGVNSRDAANHLEHSGGGLRDTRKEQHNRIVALRRVGNSGSRGPSAECCATWSDGAATSKDYGARLGNAATGIFATLRQKSMAQLAFEELEERILLRSDLSQDQVVE